jgi:hypothetical protein
MTEEPDDLVARLRREADIAPYEVYNWLNPLLTEAADEIERLRTALEGVASAKTLVVARAYAHRALIGLDEQREASDDERAVLRNLPGRDVAR